MKYYQNISSESFHFLVVKFSIYLNRRFFVMRKDMGNTFSPFHHSSNAGGWGRGGGGRNLGGGGEHNNRPNSGGVSLVFHLHCLVLYEQ